MRPYLPNVVLKLELEGLEGLYAMELVVAGDLEKGQQVEPANRRSALFALGYQLITAEIRSVMSR